MKYMSRPKRAAVINIDIDIANILGQKYRYRIDIGNGDIDPPLVRKCCALNILCCFCWMLH